MSKQFSYNSLNTMHILILGIVKYELIINNYNCYNRFLVQYFPFWLLKCGWVVNYFFNLKSFNLFSV